MNLFAQQKQQFYPTEPQPAAGQVQGETVNEFAAGKQAANAEVAPPPAQEQPTQQVVQQPAPTQPVQKPMPIINANDPLSGMRAVIPTDEEQMQRQSLINQRILALGDAFRQIGNIHNAVNGAPAQQFNNPVQEERQRYLQDKTIRDNDRYKQMAIRQSQKMAELKAKQLENENEYRNSSIAMRKAEHDRLMRNQKLEERKQAFVEDLKRKQYELDKAYKEHKMSYEDYVAQSGRISAQAKWLHAEKYQPGGTHGVGGFQTITETSHYPEVVDENTGDVKKWGTRTVRTRTAAGSNNHRQDPYGNNSKDHRNDPYS